MNRGAVDMIMTKQGEVDKGSVAKDCMQANEWYLRATEFGNATAQFRIGKMYERGRETAEDLRKSLDWYYGAVPSAGFEQASGSGGNTLAHHNIGCAYHIGLNRRGVVIQDFSMAMGWYKRAAVQGLTRVHSSSGCMYEFVLKSGHEGRICRHRRELARDNAKVIGWFAVYILGHMFEHDMAATVVEMS